MSSALDNDTWRGCARQAGAVVIRDDCVDPCGEGRVEFRLTYAGKLLSSREDSKRRERSLHIHKIRRDFHKQLRALWDAHPALRMRMEGWKKRGSYDEQVFAHDGFTWLPMVTNHNFLACAVNILLLRPGAPGNVLHDVDNRLKTIFDALRKADGPLELGSGTATGQQVPGDGETPFFVLVQDDKLITHVAVTTDTLLEPVPDADPDTAVRLVIDVIVRPYFPEMYNLEFA